jgi:hypothetical protein
MMPEQPPVRVLSLTMKAETLKSHVRPVRSNDKPGIVRASATVDFHGMVIEGIPLIEHPHGWRVGAPPRLDPNGRRPITLSGRYARAAIFRAVAATYSAMSGHAPPLEIPRGACVPGEPIDPLARSPEASRDASFPTDGAHYG